MVWTTFMRVIMRKYVFYDTDFYGTEERDIRGEEYERLIRICCKYSSVLCLKYLDVSVQAYSNLMEFEITKPENILIGTSNDRGCFEKRYYKVCPQLCAALLNVADGNIFKIPFREVLAGLDVSTMPIEQKPVNTFNHAVTERDVAGGGAGEFLAGKEFNQIHGVMTACILGQVIVLAQYDTLPPGINAWTVNMTIFGQNVDTANSEGTAGGIQLAVPNSQIVNADAGNAIVTGLQITIFQHNIVGAVDVETVATAQTGDTINPDMLAMVSLMMEITGMNGGVTLQRNIFTAGQENDMGTHIFFLTVRVEAVGAIEQTSGFTDNRNVFRTVGTDHSPTIFIPRLVIEVLRNGFQIGVHFHTFRNGENLIVRAFVTANQGSAGLKVECGIRPKPQGRNMVSTCRNNNSTAGFFAEVQYSLDFVCL